MSKENLNDVPQSLQEVVKAIMEYKKGCTFEDALEIAEAGDFMYIQGVHNMQELGEYLVSNDFIDLPSVDLIVDYEAVGQAWHKGAFTSTGYIEVTSE